MKKYEVITKEVWTNKYYVHANSPKEASNIIETGTLHKDYFPNNGTKKALPLHFVEFKNIEVLDIYYSEKPEVIKS